MSSESDNIREIVEYCRIIMLKVGWRYDNSIYTHQYNSLEYYNISYETIASIIDNLSKNILKFANYYVDLINTNKITSPLNCYVFNMNLARLEHLVHLYIVLGFKSDTSLAIKAT